MSAPSSREPRLVDALALAAGATEELVVRSVRDTHHAVADRVHAVLDGPTRGALRMPALVHRAVSGAVYGGLGLGLKAADAGLGVAGHLGIGAPFETGPRSRFVRASVNGLIGDRLVRERPRLAIDMAVRVDGADVSPTSEALAAAYPQATGRVVVLMHGLSENESYWNRDRATRGSTYVEALAADGWTPVLLRANTGLPVRENGVHLAALLDELAAAWPGGMERLALVGHSMGGLIVRAACAVRRGADTPAWGALLTDVVTLGTPHLGAPLAGAIGRGAARLGSLPETATYGRILDLRSAGVHDLVVGLGEEVPAMPHVRHRLVSATVTRSARHPVGRFLGDLLVRVESAQGRDRFVTLFPNATVLHLPRTDHFDLLNDARVEAALREWLA